MDFQPRDFNIKKISSKITNFEFTYGTVPTFLRVGTVPVWFVKFAMPDYLSENWYHTVSYVPT